MRYSCHNWIFGKEPLEKSLERIARFGYDAVDLLGDPENTDINKVKGLLNRYKLEVACIGGAFPPERDLANADEQIRKTGINYAKKCLDIASEVDARSMVVLPSGVGKSKPTAPYEKEWNLAVDSIKEIGEYAAEKNVTLVIECLNRYETYLVNKLSQAVDMAKQIDLSNVRIMADTFHMNIEEPVIADSIREVGDYIKHIHLADSNREAAGRGHIDFKSIVQALKNIGYSGYLSMEFLPSSGSPYDAIQGKVDQKLADQFTRESIEYMKKIWK